MATATVTGMTTWHDCTTLPTVSNIGGGPGPGVTDEVFMQGGAAVGRRASSGIHGFVMNLGSVNFTTAGRYLWVWAGVPLGAAGLATLANGGLRIRVGSSANNWGEWFVGGGDVTQVGLNRYVIDLASTPSATGGSGLDRANVAWVGPVCNWVSVPGGNLPHVVIDMITYGGTLTVTGGSAGDPLTWADVEAYTEAPSRAWGVARTANGATICNGDLRIEGVLRDVNRIMIWRRQEYWQGGALRSSIPDTLHGVTVAGSGAELMDGVKVGAGDAMAGRSGSLFRSAPGSLNGMHFDVSDPSLPALGLYGTQIVGADHAVAFSADGTNGPSHEIAGCTFEACAEVDSGRTVVRNTSFVDTVDDAALMWTGHINIKRCEFLANDTHGIRHTEAGSFTYDALMFSGNGADILFDAASGDLEINAAAGANPGTYTNLSSGTVTILNPRFFSFTVTDAGGAPITGYIWGLYEQDADSATLGVLLAGEQESNEATQVYAYDYPGEDVAVFVQVIKPGFVERAHADALTNADSSRTISLQLEEN